MPPKHSFRMTLQFLDKDIQQALDELENVAQGGARDIMRKMRIQGVDHARELLDRLIYMQPPRGGYERTGNLRNKVGGFVRRDAGKLTLFMFASGAPYALFNELGTYDYNVSEEEIIRMARRQANEDTDVLVVEFGRESSKKGLEPRPFLYPTMVWLEIQLAKEFELYLERVARRI